MDDMSFATCIGWSFFRLSSVPIVSNIPILRIRIIDLKYLPECVDLPRWDGLFQEYGL